VTRRAALGAAAAALCLAAPSAAAAQTPQGSLSVGLRGAIEEGEQHLVLRGRSVVVTGTVAPFVAGDSVVVRFKRGAKTVKALRAPLAATGDGSKGYFSARYKPSRTGHVSVRVTHYAIPQVGVLRRRLGVEVVGTSLAGGSRGPLVRALQRGLDRMGYAVPRTGAYDAGTARAVLAYRKVNGMARLLTASRSIVTRVLARRGAFKARDRGKGRHAEVDISRQILALVENGRPAGVYAVSTGKPSTPTVQGRFRVYRKQPGSNEKAMFYSSYFIRGYAVHGYPSVPVNAAASHGCVRVPMADAISIYGWLSPGVGVYVYA